MLKRSITAIVCVLALLGCSRQEAPVPKKASPEKTLLIGLKPEGDLFGKLQHYESIAKYLSGKIGIRIELKIFPRYQTIVERFGAERLDGAFFGCLTYASAHRTLGVEVLARPVAADNTSTHHGVILVRKDGGIRNVGGMKGKRFAFVDNAAIDGCIFPREYLRKNGVDDYRKFLKESYFAGTHEDVIRDLLAAEADVGATKSTVYRRMAKEDPRVGKELKVLARSDEMPNSGLALRKGIDPSDRDRIKEALLGMHLDPEGKELLAKIGLLRFIESTNKDYESIFRYLDDLRPRPTDGSTNGR